MANRPEIPPKLAAKVMFASDRTCCLCKIEKQRCQIHHIDENPENNVFNNLAVICAHCHIDVHSKVPFVRNYTPDLIHLFNSAWRDIVKLKLLPDTADSKSAEFAAEAFLEASLDCHNWKVRFMSLAGPGLPSGRKGQFTDVWDCFAELWVPGYTEDIYAKFLPLFDEGLLRVQLRFDRSIQLFADVFPSDFKAALVRANRQLNIERFVYLTLKNILSEPVKHADLNTFFYQRFVGVI